MTKAERQELLELLAEFYYYDVLTDDCFDGNGDRVDGPWDRRDELSQQVQDSYTRFGLDEYSKRVNIHDEAWNLYIERRDAGYYEPPTLFFSIEVDHVVG